MLITVINYIALRLQFTLSKQHHQQRQSEKYFFYYDYVRYVCQNLGWLWVCVANQIFVFAVCIAIYLLHLTSHSNWFIHHFHIAAYLFIVCRDIDAHTLTQTERKSAEQQQQQKSTIANSVRVSPKLFGPICMQTVFWQSSQRAHRHMNGCVKLLQII